MNGKRAVLSIACGFFLICPAVAEQVTVSGDQVYVTKSDCAALVTHHPSADVTYQPGADVHGKYVAPADLGGNDFPGLVPDKIEFPLQINPMNYTPQNYGSQVATSTGTNSQSSANSSTTTTTTTTQPKFANTAVAVARVAVDLKTGQTSLNGQPLTSQQEQIVGAACRKAGIR